MLRSNLKAARALIAKPENWCQRDYALNAIGEPVLPLNGDAVSWCLIGALWKVSGNWDSEAYDALTKLTKGCAANFNDNHDHDGVLALLDRAIKEVS